MLSIDDPELDGIYQQTIGKGLRTICVTAANSGEGVSTLSLWLARRGAAAGLETLLFDANVLQPSASASFGLTRARWSPTDNHSVHNAISTVDGFGLSVLPPATGVDPLMFRDRQKLCRMMDGDLQQFDLIIVDAPPVGKASGHAIPAQVIAAACDATVLVILAGVTPEYAVRAAVERLSTAGATLSGAVFNDRFNPSLVDELCRQLSFIARIAPGLASRIRKRMQRSAILNLHSECNMQ